MPTKLELKLQPALTRNANCLPEPISNPANGRLEPIPIVLDSWHLALDSAIVLPGGWGRGQCSLRPACRVRVRADLNKEPEKNKEKRAQLLPQVVHLQKCYRESSYIK